MKTWSEWEHIRRQVAISGSVMDQHGRPVDGADITIAEKPAEMVHRMLGAIGEAGRRWDDMRQRPDRTQSETDGIYWFLDLLPGEYTLRTVNPRSGLTEKKRVTIIEDKQHKTQRTTADFSLTM